jgi:hypothetical protein
MVDNHLTRLTCNQRNHTKGITMNGNVFLRVFLIFFTWTACISLANGADPDNTSFRHENPLFAHRFVTLKDQAVVEEQISVCPQNPVKDRDLALAFSSVPAGRGEILWIDRNHQNAVAQHAAISGNGAWIAGGWWLNSSRASLYAVGGSGTPEWNYPVVTSFYVPVDASFDGSVISVTGWGDDLYMFESDSASPVYAREYPVGYNGIQSATSSAGNAFLGAAFLDTDIGSVFCFDAGTGDSLWTHEVGRAEGLNVSKDGTITVVNNRTTVYVFETATGILRGTISIPGETQTPAAVSGDGEIVVTGGFNGQVRTFMWTGVEYELLWGHYTGHSWVTAVDVSDDGSTIMAGTLGFNPYRGKVLMYDVSSSEPLWEYEEYGDYVDDVSLSTGGSRGVAGSWGQYGGTYGDIFTAFSRGSADPLFSIEDDQETGVGSIQAVEISEDGYHAVASGKAVHAREWGNGGMVISISLEELPSVSINVYDPPETVAPGEVARWTIEIVNNTEETQVVDVWLSIYGDNVPPNWDPSIILIEDYKLPAGQSRSGTARVRVHPKAPGGMYTVGNLVGQFPKGAVDWESFDCEVIR